MEAELQKFRQKKQAEERNLLIQEKIHNLWNRITTSLSAAVLPEPEEIESSKKINNNSSSSGSSNDGSSCSEDEDDDDDDEEDNNVQINSEKKLIKTKVKKVKRIKSTTKTTDPPNDDLILDDNSSKWAVIAVRVSKFLMWLLTYIGFLKIGFGAVFFVISALIFIYYNTETRRKKKKGEKSAYSVFNKDCQPINGALNAEQLERQMMFGNFLG